MIGIYQPIHQIRLDDGPWIRVSSDTKWEVIETDGEKPEDLLWEKTPWAVFYELVRKYPKESMRAARRFMFVPTIRISLLHEHRPVLHITKRMCQTISYKIVYRELENLPLMWLATNLPAKTAIRYLRERGLLPWPVEERHEQD